MEFAATSAFVAGTQPARALCQEYISFATSAETDLQVARFRADVMRKVNHGLRSHVHGLKMRADTATRPKAGLWLFGSDAGLYVG